MIEIIIIIKDLRLIPAKGGIPNCGMMGGGGAAPRPARLGRGKGRPGWRLGGKRGEPAGPREEKFWRWLTLPTLLTPKESGLGEI